MSLATLMPRACSVVITLATRKKLGMNQDATGLYRGASRLSLWTVATSVSYHGGKPVASPNFAHHLL